MALALLLAGCDAGGASNGEATDSDDTADAEGGEAFYEGQTVEMIIPFGSGGGTDANCRFLAEWFSRMIAGQPTVQGVNVPGGGGLLGANQFELQSPRDGTAVMCTASSNLILQGLGHPEIRYDTTTWTPVIGVPHNGVVSVRQDSGIEEDGSNALDIEWVTAMREPGGVDTLFLLAYELLGLNVEPVFGYDGAGATRVALEQGETNLDWQTTGAYDANVVPLIEAGEVTPLFAMGLVQNGELVRAPAHEDVPTVAEFYEQLHGEPPSGEVWEAYLAMNSVVFTSQRIVWLHDDAPQEAIDAFRAASEEMAASEEFNQAAEEALGPYEMVVGEELEQIRPELRVPEEQAGFVVSFLSENYDYELDAQAD